MSSIYQELMVTQHCIIFHSSRFRSMHHYFIPLLVSRFSASQDGAKAVGRRHRKLWFRWTLTSKDGCNDPPSKHEFSAANCLLVSRSKHQLNSWYVTMCFLAVHILHILSVEWELKKNPRLEHLYNWQYMYICIYIYIYTHCINIGLGYIHICMYAAPSVPIAMF